MRHQKKRHTRSARKRAREAAERKDEQDERASRQESAGDAKALKMCGSKVRYPSKEKADFSAWSHTTGNIRFRSYQCPHCSGFHITRTRRSKPKKQQ